MPHKKVLTRQTVKRRASTEDCIKKRITFRVQKIFWSKHQYEIIAKKAYNINSRKPMKLASNLHENASK
jgi:hypothetical protein